MGISSGLIHSALLGGQAAPAASWSPADLGSALKAWFKADAGITLSGSNVTTWADQSGNGCDVSQATGANQPTYSATGFNGRPTVVFTGDNTALDSGASALSLGAGIGSFFIVGQMGAATFIFRRAMSFRKTGGSGNPGFEAGSADLILRNGNTGAAEFYAFAEGAGLGGPTSISFDTNYRLGNIFDGANVTPYVNNVAGTAGSYTGSLAATGQITVGNDAETNVGWTGPISEVVVANTALSSTDRDNLDNYFKAKWGL